MRALRGAKGPCRYLQGIGGGRERVESISAGVIGLCNARLLRGLIGKRNRRIGNGCSAGVGNGAANGPSIGLPKCGNSQREDQANEDFGDYETRPSHRALLETVMQLGEWPRRSGAFTGVIYQGERL